MLKLFIVDFDTSLPHYENNVEVLFIFGSVSAALISGTLNINYLAIKKKDQSKLNVHFSATFTWKDRDQEELVIHNMADTQLYQGSLLQTVLFSA